MVEQFLAAALVLGRRIRSHRESLLRLAGGADERPILLPLDAVVRPKTPDQNVVRHRE